MGRHFLRSAGLQPALRVHAGQTAAKSPPCATCESGKPVTDRRSGVSVRIRPQECPWRSTLKPPLTPVFIRVHPCPSVAELHR